MISGAEMQCPTSHLELSMVVSYVGGFRGLLCEDCGRHWDLQDIRWVLCGAVDAAYNAARGATRESCAQQVDRCAVQYDEEGYSCERDVARAIAAILRNPLYPNEVE